jgi:UDP-glucose 4-epimerase
MSKILLTGGLGYIGSHVAVELAENGFDMVILDDLSNSERLVLDRIQELTGKIIPFEQGDIRDVDFIDKVFANHDIAGIIHFAAKKALGESLHNPLLYFDVNVTGLVNLLKTVEKYQVKKFVFSSSCTVYGNPEHLPVKESTVFGNTPSPYGKTKQMCERILESLSFSSEIGIISLRYFNPVGAHRSGKIGELPKGIPNNLVPFITQAAARKSDQLKVFGGDYDTPDGSAIRDYIHVVDLAKAHVKALKLKNDKYLALNVGTGRGYSVLEVVNTFIDVTGVDLPYKIVDRRAGDIPVIYGDASLSNDILNWNAELSLQDMLQDAWKWQCQLQKK